MTRRKARGSSSERKGTGFRLDPIFACLVFAGVGLGTLGMQASPRLAVLWMSLLALWVVYQEGKERQIVYRYADLGRGALIGLAVSVPLVLLGFRALVTAIPILFVSVADASFGGTGTTAILVSVVLLAPVAEELFFRDILQRELGLWFGIGLYAAGGVVLFVTTAGEYPVVLIAVVGAWAVLGAMYSFFYERFGFAATLASHITVNFVLLFIPALLASLQLFT